MAQSTALMVRPCGRHDDEAMQAAQAAALQAAQFLVHHRLAERVELGLRATGYSPLRAVEVSVRGRLVMLRGRVPSHYLKQLALAAAMDVPGVRELRNEVQVVRSQGVTEEARQGAPMPTILVVDDDADTLCNMADLFDDLGYATETAGGGDIALEMARHQHYDLGLFDLRMPGMDGLTLCRHLRQSQPLMAAMIVTAYAGSGVEEEARAAGARHVVAKPIDFPRLLTLVEEALQEGGESHEPCDRSDKRAT
jgi:CheY-like chemotaxis protein